jgi:hypothetical protein
MRAFFDFFVCGNSELVFYKRCSQWFRLTIDLNHNRSEPRQIRITIHPQKRILVRSVKSGTRKSTQRSTKNNQKQLKLLFIAWLDRSDNMLFWLVYCDSDLLTTSRIFLFFVENVNVVTWIFLVKQTNAKISSLVWFDLSDLSSQTPSK